MKIAAIYARVSSDQQKQEKTIASQTATLIAFAHQENYQVPDEWIFEDEGFSGASLIRPGLEKIRDLAAAGQIQAVLVLSPDRLSRKYAYQVLLTEELARQGVETVFVKAPQAETPEDHLLVQFQGMIAEYERAQILERSRRRLETLNRDLIRVRKSRERLLTAYQEELLSLDELRVRMPPLRQREQALQAELQNITSQTADREAYLRLAETLTAFLERLRTMPKLLISASVSRL